MSRPPSPVPRPVACSAGASGLYLCRVGSSPGKRRGMLGNRARWQPQMWLAAWRSPCRCWRDPCSRLPPRRAACQPPQRLLRVLSAGTRGLWFLSVSGRRPSTDTQLPGGAAGTLLRAGWMGTVRLGSAAESCGVQHLLGLEEAPGRSTLTPARLRAFSPGALGPGACDWASLQCSGPVFGALPRLSLIPQHPVFTPPPWTRPLSGDSLGQPRDLGVFPSDAERLPTLPWAMMFCPGSTPYGWGLRTRLWAWD